LESPRWFNKILVSTDGSLQSVVAQELAALLATKFRSEVTVIHAVSHELLGLPLAGSTPAEHEYVPVGAEGGQPITYLEGPKRFERSLPQGVSDEIRESLNERGKAIVADAMALFEQQDIEANEKIENADPTEAILNEAESGNYDLIAMGSSGEHEQALHLGSVARKVSLHAKTSVLIARERNKISKILVPIDGSADGQKAWECAMNLAQKTDAKITLMNVLEPRLFGMKPKLSKDIGSQILSHTASQAKGVTIDQKLESGDSARTIIKTAKDGDCDVIAMGSKGHGTVRRLMLGSVSDHVIHYADRSVLLVK
jgi:nucleotide-binding universal stress UspA family protein